MYFSWIWCRLWQHPAISAESIFFGFCCFYIVFVIALCENCYIFLVLWFCLDSFVLHYSLLLHHVFHFANGAWTKNNEVIKITESKPLKMYSQRAAAMANIITIIIITALAGWISLLHPQKIQKNTRIVYIGGGGVKDKSHVCNLQSKDSWGIPCAKFEHVCMCLKERPGIQESCSCRWKIKNNPERTKQKIKLWYLRFLMRLCIWCRKETPGIEECLVNAPKITCTQFGTPESPGIRTACILVFFSSIPTHFRKNSAGTARNVWGDINSIYVSAGNSQEQE